MSSRDYLPSGQFTSTTVALLLSGILIAAAFGVNPFRAGGAGAQLAVVADASLAATNADWEKSFANDSVPQDMAAIQNTADRLSEAVQSKNLTESIAKSLAIQTFALQGQGIADSATAQQQAVSKILADAAAKQKPAEAAYTQKQVAVSSNGKSDLRAYGNALPKTIAARPSASEAAALLPAANYADQSTASALKSLSLVALAYRALAVDIIRVPTPPMLAPIALQLANNYAAMAGSVDEMSHMGDDPVRGLLGLQNFKATSNQNISLLLTIGSNLKSSGIVYVASEPGAAWSRFAVAMQTVAQARSEQAQSAINAQP